MSSQDQTPYVAACPECDATRQTDSPNEIIDFYRRHYRVTGHDIDIVYTDTDLDTGITAQDLKDAIRQLEKHHQNGVPVGVIAAVMNERGLSVKDTLDQIHELRMGGELYEPQDDHLSAF